MGKQQNHHFEAELQPKGKEWEVTIIGAQSPEQVMTVNGREFVRSKNGRLYAVDAIKNSAAMWEGVKVYDDHMTDEQFQARQGMRSPKNEWLGSLVQPRFVRENGLPQLRAIFKVVEDSLARKLKNAWEAGVLNTIGLSLDAFTDTGSDAVVEGKRYSVVEGFKDILSVDLVGNPAAGGGFVRLIAAIQPNHEELNMSEETNEQGFITRDEFKELVSEVVAETLAATKTEEAEMDIDDMSDEEVVDANIKRKEAEAKLRLQKLEREAREERRKTDLARTELMVERKLEKAKLPDKFEEAVRAQFAGRIVEAAEVDKAIKLAKEAYASLDPTGRVSAGRYTDIEVGLGGEERFALAFQRQIMGEKLFTELEHTDDASIKERVGEANAYKAWLNNGKPALPRYSGISALLQERFGGNPLLDSRAMEAATTSSLATVVKNTVNILTANAYSQRELWFERVARVEEVDTIDQTTLARVYGVDTLDTVSEGAAYTELVLQDEEETAAFVKRGNYIGFTLEAMMSDKIGYFRRIPEILANTWYNTQSALVSGVFTVNSAAGPVLGTSGALFNATAVGSAGGHANLLTTALSHAAYGAARTAMMKQTDQPLGAGRKLLIQPRYLLVPVDLETTALNIRNSELVPEADGSTTTGNQTINNYRGQFEVLVVPDWTDVTNWALVADPMQWPSIWLIYPRGQRTPQIFGAESETGGSMFTNDELRFKVRLMTYRFSATYDCAPVSDFRPLHKSNVAG